MTKQIVSDGLWTRFQNPRAVWAGGWLFIGHYVADEQGIAVTKIDRLGDQVDQFILSSTESADDHNVAAVGVRPDGRLIAAYCAHGDSVMRVRISDHPFDVSSWSAEQQLTSGLGITYPQLFYLSAEKRWYLFFRGIDPGESHRPHRFITSDDDGETWTDDPIALTNTAGTQRPYLQIDSNGLNRIDISLTDGHPKEVADNVNSIYHLYYQSGEWFTSGGVSLGEPPFDHADLVRVWDGAIRTSWNWDMLSGLNPRMLFDTFVAPGDDNHVYRHAYWNGTQWEIGFVADAGGGTNEVIVDDAGSPGICFDRSNVNTVFMSREVAPQTFEMSKMTTTDNGQTWGDETAVTSGTVYPIKNFRPTSARGPGPFHLLWLRGTYTHFLDPSGVGIYADLEVPAPAPPPPGPIETGVSEPVIRWASYNFVTGNLITELPDLDGPFGRLLGAHTSTGLVLPIPLSGPAAIGNAAFEATVPGITMLVAIINGEPAWGGRVIDRRGGTAGTLNLSSATTEAYLKRRKVQDHEFIDVDEAEIMATLLNDANGRLIPGFEHLGPLGGINLEIEAPDVGVTRTDSYLRSDRTTVYDQVRERSSREGGLEWTIEIRWGSEEMTETGIRNKIRKVARVAPRIGVTAAQPKAVFETTADSVFESRSGNEATYEYQEDYTERRAATWVEAYAPGEGEAQPSSDPAIDVDKLLAGWPIDEYHWQPSSSIEDVAVLNSHAQRELELRQNGARLWSIQSRWNVYPQLNIDWRMGDDIAWSLVGHRHPPTHDDNGNVIGGGVLGQGRCIGWQLDPSTGLVVPIMLDPTSGG